MDVAGIDASYRNVKRFALAITLALTALVPAARGTPHEELVAKQRAAPIELKNPRFGILRGFPDGSYELAQETARIPKLLKPTGFRFGITFDNPTGAALEFYTIMHFPSPPRELTGAHRLGANDSSIVRSDTFRTSEPHAYSFYWFDEDDPLGTYHVDLYVNGVQRYSGTFEVVSAR